MSRVRILVASGICPPDPGGPATHLAQLLPSLRDRGHEVRVITFGRPRSSDQDFHVRRIDLDTALPLRMLRFANVYRRDAAWADVVYAATSGLPRSGPKRPTILRVSGDRAWELAMTRGLVDPMEDIDAFQDKGLGLIVRGLKLARAREARMASRVIVPSEYLRRMVIQWNVHEARVRVIHSAVETGPLPATNRSAARQLLRWSPEDRSLLAVARLTAWKGVDHLIDAVARLSGVRLVVVGDGPERPALMARAAARGVAADFVGALERDRTLVYLQASDYLVLYSGYEGLSHTILESLRAGTPVVASRRGGNPEIIRDGWNGILVDHPDPEALVAALERAFEGDTRDQLAAHATESVGPFSWSSVGPELIREIETVGGPSSLAAPV
jgi:glycosyltransferase involved in cell wall biosynthesis